MSNRGAWIIGGTTLIGLAIGLILLGLQFSALFMVASILLGIGVGLVFATWFSGGSTQSPAG
ncbi:MAG: hypothetical protein KIT77_29805 [Caldilinea sp.]|nr:hypothetical protein [Caldilineaceae bacterium]MCO5247116.1 hypothetical protein [Anaerolineae bacterium]MCW5845485.1 hypothetical protein [Caldilinea sp.]